MNTYEKKNTFQKDPYVRDKYWWADCVVKDYTRKPVAQTEADLKSPEVRLHTFPVNYMIYFCLPTVHL